MCSPVYLAQQVGSYMSRNDVWEQNLSHERLQAKADAYIEKLKAKRRTKDFAETLPLPIRLRAEQISDMNLSRMGRLSFFAESDNHDFKIGIRRRRSLRDALWQAGLGRV
jgi:hypothetical protein